MRLRGAALAAIAVAAGISPSIAGPYARPSRVAYVAAALDAVRRLGPRARALDEELHRGARRRCRAELRPPTVPCLLELGRTTCDGEPDGGSCRLAADIIFTNRLSETELVDEATRLQLLRRGGDFRAAMQGELGRRTMVLAADLALAEPGPEAELPARIDRFCAARERALPWQRCVAAIVWYVGTHEPAKTPR